MNYPMLSQFLIYSLMMNYMILFLWFFIFIYARNFLKKLHSQWFNLSDQTFDTIHYSGMAMYKIAILLLNLVPFIAIVLIQKT
ncbi:DUF6868 family protein [Acinetobacter sp. ANC 4648]|uniref:DUF6868 family protein n=1 Tax=Acinetobacter sp. ANC 4648 TaxID=1977875 RepID=UPI000A32B715|nr:hypothetical protein [Acinetobacter sp. ANC 4648]OTG83929.1 hypothetical protein B9T27_05370 [Acinetobacter sp. ANC 4648]